MSLLEPPGSKCIFIVKELQKYNLFPVIILICRFTMRSSESKFNHRRWSFVGWAGAFEMALFTLFTKKSTQRYLGAVKFFIFVNSLMHHSDDYVTDCNRSLLCLGDKRQCIKNVIGYTVELVYNEFGYDWNPVLTTKKKKNGWSNTTENSHLTKKAQT